MYNNFNDDVYVPFLLIMKNDFISFIREYRVVTLGHGVTSSMTSSHEKYFFLA